MRFKEFKVETITLGPESATPGAPSAKNKGTDIASATGDRTNPHFNEKVLALQKDLKTAGADLGSFGPNKDGLDGVMGPKTRQAISKFPDISAKHADAVKVNNAGSSNVDLSVIQDPDFNAKLEKVASALGIDSSTLRAIIKHESGFRPDAEDPNHISVGLIGFTEKTANSLGTSKAELKKMSATEQLDYVYRFYKMVGVRSGDDKATIYMLTFMPAFAHASDDVVLGQQGGGTLILPNGKSSGLSMDKVWSQNPVFGKSKGRSSFTVGDVKNHFNSYK